MTSTTVNPARSPGPAIFVGGRALAQLWLFWPVPILGGLLGGAVYRRLIEDVPAGTLGAPRSTD